MVIESERDDASADLRVRAFENATCGATRERLHDRVRQRAAELGYLARLSSPAPAAVAAASGLFHLNARVATSPTIPAMSASLVSPGSGTVSTPPAHTAEYARIESRP